MMSRRVFMARAAGVGLLLAGGRRLWALSPAAPVIVTVYKSRTCGCCAEWVSYLDESGFTTVVHDEEEMDMVKDNLGVPRGVRSCHTAQVEQYLIEGHVPADDMRRILKEQPKVAGLAVPGMPASAPGMATPGAPHQPYEVLAFGRDGVTEVFTRH